MNRVSQIADIYYVCIDAIKTSKLNQLTPFRHFQWMLISRLKCEAYTQLSIFKYAVSKINDKHAPVHYCQVTWWRHQMESFSALLAFCAGNSPQKGQWRGTLMLSFICVWINGWVKHHEAGDFRRYRAHCDVIVMQNKLFQDWVP